MVDPTKGMALLQENGLQCVPWLPPVCSSPVV